jgi:general secretion pathway protein G
MKIHCSNSNSIRRLGRRAFTLVEMLLVITIIGILAAMVVPKMIGRTDQARKAAVANDLAAIKTALDAFEVDNGYYPKGKNGLMDLLQMPRDARAWHGPYLEKLPMDPWQDPYIYEFPGKHNPGFYDVYSAGPDGKAGTDDDIGNWQSK